MIKFTKNALTIIIILLTLTAFVQSVDDFQFRKVSNNDFEKGETLTYIAGYAMVDAGRAVVKLDKEIHEVNGRPCYKVDVTGETIGVFSWTMTIKDLWQSYIDTASIIPWQFHRDITENSYRLIETTEFDHVNKKAKVKGWKRKKENKTDSIYDINTYAQDLISGYYYLRTLEYEKMQEGDTITLDAFFEDESYDFKIIYLGKEKCFTKFGRVDSFVMSPIMPDNALFYGKHPIKFWVSNDANRVPVKVQAEMLVGAVEINLVKHKGLKTKLGRFE